MARRRVTWEMARAMREEYSSDLGTTYEYLSDKYEVGKLKVSTIILNQDPKFYDPNYTPPDTKQRKGGYTKKKVYIPDETREMVEEKIPRTTQHRARGSNWRVGGAMWKSKLL